MVLTGLVEPGVPELLLLDSLELLAELVDPVLGQRQLPG